MRVTDKHVFFYRAKLGQWTIAPMMIEGIRYNCCEQYMMHQKALLFGDKRKAEVILRVALPKAQKDLGRQVHNFDSKVWDENAKRIVYEGNFAKFTQYKDLRELLLSFGERKFVEASPTDLIWGVGFEANDPMIDDESNWKGKNWLGEVLTELRDDLALIFKK